MQDRSLLRWLIILILGALLICLCAIACSPISYQLWAQLAGYYDLLSDRERVHALVQSSGSAGPLILIALHVTQVLLAPIPGDAFCLLGGYMFGTINGFLLSTLGMMIGSVINFYFGRLLGERCVRRIVSAKAYAKYDKLVQGKRILLIFLLFLVPGSPKDILCMLFGLTTVPFRMFVALSTASRMPTTAAFSMQGAAFFSRDYTIFAIISLACGLFAMLAFLARGSIARWMDQQYEKGDCGTI